MGSHRGSKKATSESYACVLRNKEKGRLKCLPKGLTTGMVYQETRTCLEISILL